MRNSIENQVAIVTGGANGIGRAAARRYAREGAHVVVADIEFEHAQKVAEEIRTEGGQALAAAVDVRSRESVDELFARAAAEFGRVDILAAIAGIAPADAFVDLPEEHWDQTLAVNLKGVFLCGQAAARQMIAQGAGGRIINMSSTNGLVGEEEFAHYNASKFGVVGLTMTMAIELAPYKMNMLKMLVDNGLGPIADEHDRLVADDRNLWWQLTLVNGTLLKYSDGQ